MDFTPVDAVSHFRRPAIPAVCIVISAGQRPHQVFEGPASTLDLQSTVATLLCDPSVQGDRSAVADSGGKGGRIAIAAAGAPSGQARMAFLDKFFEEVIGLGHQCVVLPRRA